MTLDAAQFSEIISGLSSLASDLATMGVTLSTFATTLTGGVTALPTYSDATTRTTPILPKITSSYAPISTSGATAGSFHGRIEDITRLFTLGLCCAVVLAISTLILM
jgi:hypothetical protein